METLALLPGGDAGIWCLWMRRDLPTPGPCQPPARPPGKPQRGLRSMAAAPGPGLSSLSHQDSSGPPMLSRSSKRTAPSYLCWHHSPAPAHSSLLCCCSVAQSCPNLCDPTDCSTQASLSFTISWSLLKLLSIESVMPSNHLILCCPPSSVLSLSRHQDLFQWSVLRIRWPKCWSFSISPSRDYSGLISFRMDWLDLLAVQGTSSTTG